MPQGLEGGGLSSAFGPAALVAAPFSLPGFVISAGITVLAGSLLGKLGKKSASQRPPLLLDVPQSQAFSGAPAAYAMGHRIRTPAFLMYRQDPERAQRSSSGGGKGGSQARNNVRQVLYDCAYALNHRKTNRLIQLQMNGRGVYFAERNFVFIETHRWAGVASGGGLLITMTDRFEQDFSKVFQAKRKEGGTSSGSNTSTTLNDTSKTWTAHQWRDHKVWIATGTGNGQAALIQDNTATQLILYSGYAWSVTPNATSTYYIDGQGDDVILRGWSNSQNSYWTVVSTTAHTSATPSTIYLEPRDGQTAASSVGGSELAPARIERADNAIVDNDISVVAGATTVQLRSPTYDFYRHFRVGDRVTLRNFRHSGSPALNGGNFIVRVIGYRIDGGGTLPYYHTLLEVDGGWSIGSAPFDAGTRGTSGRVEWDTQSRFLSGSMGGASFYQGTATQTADAVLVARLGLNIPAFRDCSYVVLQQYNATEQGNAPTNAEAILEIEPAYGNLAAPLQELFERAGVSAAFCDASACAGILYHGSYLRGPQSSLDHLGSLLLFYQVASQDRAGRVHFFPLADCPQIQLLNDSDRSEMGVTIGPDAYAPKQIESSAEPKDLPQSVTIRYQNVSRNCLDDESTFGLRNPSASTHPNKDELGLTFLASSPNVARDAASSILRRTHVNARRFALSLGVRRLNVLENDALVWTDDEGEEHVARVVTAMVNTVDWTIQVQTVEEDLSLDVAGSGVTSLVDVPPPVNMVIQPQHVLVVLDIPPLDDAHAYQPGVYIACCSRQGGIFRGATAYGSRDGGNHYSPIAQFDAEVAIGESTDVLSDGIASEDPGGGVTIDATASVTVQLDSLGVDGGLSSATTADVLAGANRFQLGDEIMAFETATQLDERTYVLSDLYRGLRGTPTANHAIGERFVLLTDFLKNGGKFVPLSGAAIGDTLDVKLVPAGQTLADVAAESTVLEFWNVRPLPPWDSGSGFLTASGSDFIFAPLPKTRLNTPIGSAGPFPFDESFEEFKLVLYTDATYGTEAGDLTFTSRQSGVAITQRLLSRTTLYTAAMQTIDGFTPPITPGTLYYGVRQIGDFGGGAQSREWRGSV